jgi:hypothetical protein
VEESIGYVIAVVVFAIAGTVLGMLLCHLGDAYRRFGGHRSTSLELSTGLHHISSDTLVRAVVVVYTFDLFVLLLAFALKCVLSACVGPSCDSV